VSRDDRDYRSHHKYGEQSRQLPSVSLEEAGHDAFVVVAAVEEGVDQRDRENAVAGSAQEHPDHQADEGADDEQRDQRCGQRGDREAPDEVQRHVDQRERHGCE